MRQWRKDEDDDDNYDIAADLHHAHTGSMLSPCLQVQRMPLAVT